MEDKSFNIIVYTGDPFCGKAGFITYHKVSSIEKFKKFISEKYKAWKFATVYYHSDRSFKEIIKP